MLKTEFEARFGKSVTDEQYKDIERLYMASELMKDEFVNEFKKLSKAGEVSPLLLNLAGAIHGEREVVKTLRDKARKLGAWLIYQSDRDDITPEFAKALRAKALEQLGEKVYLTALLEMDSPLNEYDLAEIYEKLNKIK